MTLQTSSTSRWVHFAVVSSGYRRPVRLLRALRGTAVLGVEVGALALLLRLDLPSVDWSHVSTWLETVDPEDAVVALVRAAAIATAAYLLATTALYVAASLTRVPALIRGASLVTLPGLRRVVDGALAATIVVAPTSLAFGASPVAAQSAPVIAHAYSPSPAGDTGPIYEPTPAGGEAPARPAATHVVRRGDSLWMIATEHLAAARGVPADAVPQLEVAEAWRAIVNLNVSSLSSGDPNLIYPGEIVQLPAL
jgi:nucleoid-associated protein YgaU